MIALSLDPGAASIVRPGVLVVRSVTVAERCAGLDGPMADSARVLQASTEAVDTVSAVRSMYRQFGVDPTKTRPSSEALLRRVRRGEPLPRVNSIVDIGNWCSVETQLPYGLYDLDQMSGAIEVRLGRPGEEYPGIRKDVVHVAGRLVVADASGPFGNPTSDSARTMVTSATTSVLVVIYAPARLAVEHVDAALALTRDRILTYASGQVQACRVLTT